MSELEEPVYENPGEEQPETRKKRPPVTAQNKLMDYLARRDHSEKELREKLSKNFEVEEIDRAIQTAKDSGWMADPQELAEKVRDSLSTKGKGAAYIRQYLIKKGLPTVSFDEDLELEKGRKLIAPLIQRGEDKPKLHRYLVNRGYEHSIIRKVIYEK